MSSKNSNKLPAWDLSDMYKGIDDPKIGADLEKFRKNALSFAKKYKGKLAGLTAAEFLSALKAEEKMSVLGGNARRVCLSEHGYADEEQRRDGLLSEHQRKTDRLQQTDHFFSLEINRLPDAKIKEWLEDKRVAFYKPWLDKVRRFKKYELSEAVEEILHEKSVTSGSAWVRLYEETSSRLVFTVDGRQYNDAEISKLLLDKDPQIREKAGKEINRVCKENAPLFTMIYNMVIKDKAIEDEKRGFKRPVSERNLAENVKDSTVDVLAQTVRENYKNIAHRFYKLKAKWLGVDKIQYWDRNAPLPFCDDAEYSWDESVKIVLNAYKEFSPKLYNVAKDFFDNDWIDVPPRDGKRSGAFCASATAEHHPYLLLNLPANRMIF